MLFSAPFAFFTRRTFRFPAGVTRRVLPPLSRLSAFFNRSYLFYFPFVPFPLVPFPGSNGAGAENRRGRHGIGLGDLAPIIP